MADLAKLMEPAARLLLGDPNERMCSALELRWGRKGSISVDLERGIWHDHATDEGGGLLDLIHREVGTATTRAAFEWLERAGLLPPREGVSPLTAAERADLRRRMDAARAARRAETERRHAEASERAARIWAHCWPADPAHPYLVRKRVAPHYARQHGPRLVLPVTDPDGRLWSLQFIDQDGGKRLLTGGRKRGCFVWVDGRLPGNGRILVCEGWATGATLAEAEPQSRVLAAIDAGNLEPVAVGLRARFPGAEIVICADADPVGMAKGRAAAIAAGALLAAPEFPPGAAGTDWNDLAALRAQGARP